MQQGRLFTWLSFGSALPAKVAQFSVGANSGDARVLDAFRVSVAETMGEMERDMHARVRTGGHDTDRRTANMIWAEFVHRTARPVDGVPDPQLHCHAVAFNATFDSVEERWKAGQFGSLVRDKLYYQAAFHARLADRLSDLGYDVRRDGTSFTLAGIPRDTLGKFSRRTAAIEAEAERLGIVDPKQKGELGRRTREAKGEGESMEDLRAVWVARLSEVERQAIATPGGSSVATDAAKRSRAVEAVSFAVEHCFERESVVPEKRLLAEALMEGVGKVRVADVTSHAKQAGILRRNVDGQTLATTREVLQEESAMVAFARDGRGQHKKLGGIEPLVLDSQLSQEQREAALLILNSRDTVTGLRGGAGTGKTRLMQETVAAIQAAGSQVFTFAPSARASRGVLRSEGFESADTVERLLTDTGLHEAVRGQVLWIDEAGLLSSRDMKRLFDLARDEGCRVVLAGDSAQHSSVGRGDALRLLERDAGLQFARLRDIRRQTSDEYREAVREISHGEERGEDGMPMLLSGLRRLDRLGAIVEAQGSDRYTRLADDYAEATAQRAPGGRLKTALVVSPTHHEGDRAATAIRDALTHAGRLTGSAREFASLKALGLTEAERGSVNSYQVGNVVRFHQNARGFRRGERVSVTAIGSGGVTVVRTNGSRATLPLAEAKKFEVYETRALSLRSGDRIRITINGYTAERSCGGKSAKNRLNNGEVFEVDGFTQHGDVRLTNGFVVPKDYGGIAQGYVVTSHAAQGATVDTVLIALGSDSLAAANRQQFYVSVSRGREAVRLYTDDKEALREAVQADASRLTATELLDGRNMGLSKRPALAARLIAMQRSRRAYQGVRQRAHSQWQNERHIALSRQEAWHGRH
jgi:conjugative relaxase-like TrwC/TraI family protein